MILTTNTQNYIITKIREKKEQDLKEKHFLESEYLVSFYQSYDGYKWDYNLIYIVFDTENSYIISSDFYEGQKYIKGLKIIPFRDLRRLI